VCSFSIPTSYHYQVYHILAAHICGVYK